MVFFFIGLMSNDTDIWICILVQPSSANPAIQSTTPKPVSTTTAAVATPGESKHNINR